MHPIGDSFNPESPILILTIDTNHKTKEGEIKEYNESLTFFSSKIGEDSRSILFKNRKEIFHHLKNNEIRWESDENELFNNQNLKNGKDFFGSDENARYLPAIYRYTGGVFSGLGDKGKECIPHSLHHLLILTACYGLIKPFEPIQFYSCQFGDHNEAYKIWNQDEKISDLLVDYIKKYDIKRIFDFTYCSVPAFHEIFNWSKITKRTNVEILHAYHRWGEGDDALPYFGTFIRNQILLAQTSELLEMKPNAWIDDIIFKHQKKEQLKKISSKKDEFSQLLEDGESATVEFKSRALWSLDPKGTNIDRPLSPEQIKYGQNASKFIIAKTIASFLNTKGGDLIIGLLESKDDQAEDYIMGIERDYRYINDKVVDGYQRMIIDSILRKYFDNDFFNRQSNYISFEFKKIQGKTLCRIKIKKSDSAVFLYAGNEDLFFVRTGAETRELKGRKETHNYISAHFKQQLI
jgi:hypothetical protein